MRYVDFLDGIARHLRRRPAGATWAELREALRLPYERPCPTWVRRLEEEIGLERARGAGRAWVWRLRRAAGGAARTVGEARRRPPRAVDDEAPRPGRTGTRAGGRRWATDSSAT